VRQALWIACALIFPGMSWATPVYIDLSKAANIGPAQSMDGESYGGEDLKEKEGFANIPQGPQTFRGIPFQLLEGATHQGKCFIALKGSRKTEFPEAVALPAGSIKAEELYFLHTCRWGGTDPKIKVAEYDIIYDDGQVAVIPLHVGVELANFTGADDTAASVLAWWHKYKNTDMGLNLYVWKNPRPETSIQTILFKSLNKMPVPLLFAITASDKEMEVSKTSPKPEKVFVTDTKDWSPLPSPDESPAGTAMDMSGLLDAPAGKHGRVKADNDHLVFEDGTSARFWGIRLGSDWSSSDPTRLERLAGHLAILGCNLVEIEGPLIQWQAFPANLKGFISLLKAKGIYVLFLGDEKSLPQTMTDDPSILPKNLLIMGHAEWNKVTPSGTDPVTFNDSPMVMDLKASLAAQGIWNRTLGSPFGFQWTYGWPNEYVAESPLLVSAYSAFEDWPLAAGMAFSGREGTSLQPGDALETNPLVMAQWPIAALAYLRGDLKEGRIFVSQKEANPLTSLAHRSGLQPEGGSFKTDGAGQLKARVNEKNQSIVCDTEQIHWQGNVGLVQISSPRFQAIIGFLGHKKIGSPVWQVESPNPFGSLSLISLNKTNLWASDHMLLTGITREENTGQVYNALKTKLLSLGTEPVLTEPLQAKFTIFRYQKDPKLKVRALDVNGQVLKVKVPLKWAKNNMVLSWVASAFYLEIYK